MAGTSVTDRRDILHDADWWDAYRNFKQAMLRQFREFGDLGNVKLRGATMEGIAYWAKVARQASDQKNRENFDIATKNLGMWCQLRKDLR